MPEIRIIRAIEEATTDASGRVQSQIRVEYAVGEDGPFVERFPKEGFSASRALQELEKLAREIAALRDGAGRPMS